MVNRVPLYCTRLTLSFASLQLIFTPAATVSSIQSDVSSASSSSQPPPVSTQVSLVESVVLSTMLYQFLCRLVPSCDVTVKMLLSVLQVQNLTVRGTAGEAGAVNTAQLPALAMKPATLSHHPITKPAGCVGSHTTDSHKRGESPGTDSQAPTGRTTVSTHAIIAPGEASGGWGPPIILVVIPFYR